MSYDAELAFAKQLAVEAGQIMRQYLTSDAQDTTWKHDNSPVTIADTTINRLVIDTIKTAYPDHGVIGEEDSYNDAASTVWVCDPIDGTVPFTLGIPASTFCLALVRDGIVQLGIVYDPFLDHLYSAVRGQGTCRNNVPMQVSNAREFKNSYMSVGDTPTPGSEDMTLLKKQLRGDDVTLVSLVSFSYIAARVATSDMLAACMRYGSPWDAAAISIIIEEAGGKATDLQGNPRDYSKYGDGILLSNGLVHKKLVKMIADARG